MAIDPKDQYDKKSKEIHAKFTAAIDSIKEDVLAEILGARVPAEMEQNFTANYYRSTELCHDRLGKLVAMVEHTILDHQFIRKNTKK